MIVRMPINVNRDLSVDKNKTNINAKPQVDICKGCMYFDGICVRMTRECLRQDRFEEERSDT
jgi:hypothetical protein